MIVKKILLARAALADFRQALIDFLPNKTTTLMSQLMVHRFFSPGLQIHSATTLIADTDIPYTTLSWGKTLLDEHSERWAGTYAGVASRPVVKKRGRNCECLIKIGVQYTDTTTAGFSQDINEKVVVDLHYERASLVVGNFAPIALKGCVTSFA